MQFYFRSVRFAWLPLLAGGSGELSVPSAVLFAVQDARKPPRSLFSSVLYNPGFGNIGEGSGNAGELLLLGMIFNFYF